MTSATVPMAKKNDSPPPEPEKIPKVKGRPKGGGRGRITTRYAISYTPEHKAWMDDFMDDIGEIDAAGVFRDALRYYAVNAKGFRPPPKM